MKPYPELAKACFFLGYPRSGHTLLGALLDAHPNCCVSHQQDILGQLLRGEMTTEQVLESIIANSQRQFAEGRTNAGYRYSIPHQWQGKFTNLRMIGDKSGGRSSRLLNEYTPALQRLQFELGLELYFIHVIRNPYDSISTSVNRAMERRRKPVLEDIYSKKTARFFEQANAIHQFKQSTDFPVYDLYFEQFVMETQRQLRHFIEWLGLPETNGYIHDCTSIVFSKAREPRRNTHWWNAERKAQIAKEIAGIPFLQSYSFE